MEARAWHFEFTPRYWYISGGVYTHVWGIGLHFHVCQSSAELDISIGPLTLHAERFF